MIRQTRRQGPLGLLGAAMLAIITCRGAAHAQCMYDVHIAPNTSDGPVMRPLSSPGIGEDGVIAGFVNFVFDQPGLWGGENQIVFLGFPAGADNGRAMGVFNRDAVVGYTNLQAVSWINGVPQLLPTPARITTGKAFAINRSLQIVGFTGGTDAGGDPAIFAALWDQGQYIELENPLGGVAINANDINDKGQIIGWADPPMVSSTNEHAILWDNGEAILLGQIPWGTRTEPEAINNRGMIVGGGWANDINQWSAFFHETGQFIRLSTPPDIFSSFSSDISDAGQAVGVVILRDEGSGFDFRGYLWQNGAAYDLNDLVLPTGLPNFTVGTVYAINQRGEMVVDFTTTARNTAILIPVGRKTGDVDINCVVDINDFLCVLSEWGEPNSFADTDDDGIVGIDDFLNVLANWG